MTDRRTDHHSPAEIRGARAATGDDRASGAWKRAAHTMGRLPAAKSDLAVLMRVKGWQPVWGRYLLTGGRRGAMKILRRRLARP